LHNVTFLIILVAGVVRSVKVYPYALPQFGLQLPSTSRAVTSFHVNPSAVAITTHSQKQQLPQFRVVPALPFELPTRTFSSPFHLDITKQQLPLETPPRHLIKSEQNNFVSAAASIDGSNNKLSVNILLPDGADQLHDSYGTPATEYGIPHAEYGIPHEEYGIPPGTFQRHQQYGVPPPEEDNTDKKPEAEETTTAATSTTTTTTTTSTTQRYEQKPPEDIHTFGPFSPYPVNPIVYVKPIDLQHQEPHGHIFGTLLKLKKHFFGGWL
jgi:hypothetical protein